MDIYEEFMTRLGVKVDWHVIDELIVSDANILRPVKGHAFEFMFDNIFKDNFGIVLRGGTGDSDIDRQFEYNGKKYTMQLKTPATSTIRSKIRFGVNLHKTHGMERRPNNLYPMQWPCPICNHEGEEFPDFLVILHPVNGILIIPKDCIPENTTFIGHFADPSYFEWESEFINRWDLLGFPNHRGETLENRIIPLQKKLPRTAEKVMLTDEEIVTMWLRPENFRTIEMNLKGNLREPAFSDMLHDLGVETIRPTESYPKYDRKTLSGTKIQIKGPSKSLCNRSLGLLGCEVMGTHGNGSIRCYSDTDFDFLGFVIDPKYLPEDLGLDLKKYHFCIIPISALPLHFKNVQWNLTNKIYPRCKFEIKKIGNDICLVPYNNYNVDVRFRSQGPWVIDKLPSSFV